MRKPARRAAGSLRRREPWQVRVAVDGPQPHQHRDDQELHDQDATVRGVPQPRQPAQLGPRVVGSGHDDREQAEPGQPREARRDGGERLA